MGHRNIKNILTSVWRCLSSPCQRNSHYLWICKRNIVSCGLCRERILADSTSQLPVHKLPINKWSKASRTPWRDGSPSLRTHTATMGNLKMAVTLIFRTEEGKLSHQQRACRLHAHREWFQLPKLKLLSIDLPYGFNKAFIFIEHQFTWIYISKVKGLNLCMHGGCMFFQGGWVSSCSTRVCSKTICPHV